MYEASAVNNGWVGRFFNEVRILLGNKASAILTLMIAVSPLYVGVQYWLGRIK